MTPEANLSDLDIYRCRKIAERSVATFNLDLTGLTVLTEAATGWFAMTPLVAALSGASEVLCLTRASRFGGHDDVAQLLTRLASSWGVSGRIHLLESRESKEIGNADIVTNSGFVRPLDSELMRQLKEPAAVPLMFEAWEYRESDIDLKACEQRRIVILGTNERDSRLRTFEYVGYVAAKLLFELGIEVLGANVVVVGYQGYSDDVARVLGHMGCRVTRIFGPEFPDYREAWENSVSDCDAIVFAEHRSSSLLFGEQAGLSPDWLKMKNPGAAIAHIAGNIDATGTRASGIPMRPEKIAPAGFMSANVGYLGPRPVIDLNTAGLRVGEVVARLLATGTNADEIESSAQRIDSVCGTQVRPVAA